MTNRNRPHILPRLGFIGLFTAVILLVLSGCAPHASQAATLPTLRPTAVSPQDTATATAAALPTSTPSPTATHTPTITPSPPPTSTPTIAPSPTAVPSSQQINGLTKDTFIILPTAVQNHIREIYAAGQEMGRRPQVFSKLGDSGAATPDFLMRFDQRTFDLGDYAYLQPTIDYYKGSFVHFGAALHIGLHATAVFLTDLVTEELCNDFEDMLSSEFRLSNPSILLIALGTNDESDEFDDRMEKIVAFTIDHGVIPVLITKADRHEGADNRNNNDVRRIAAKYNVPLLDFDLLAETLPNRGLTTDNTHLTHYGPFEYTSPEAFERGYSVYNLATIMMLDEIRRVLAEPAVNTPTMNYRFVQE